MRDFHRQSSGKTFLFEGEAQHGKALWVKPLESFDIFPLTLIQGEINVLGSLLWTFPIVKVVAAAIDVKLLNAKVSDAMSRYSKDHPF